MKNKRFLVCFSILFLLFLNANVRAEEVSVLKQKGFSDLGKQKPNEVNETPENRSANSLPAYHNDSCEKTHWLNYIFNNNHNFIMVQNVSSGQNSVSIEYPAVDELEKTILGRVYPEEDIYLRLNRLETSVFGGVTAASLSERVNKLKEVVPEKKQYTAYNTTYNNKYYNNNKFRNRNQAMSYAGNYSQHNTIGNNYVPNYAVELYELEKEFLGQTYSSESMEVRLTRLEKEVFDSTSEDYPVEDRIQRLSAYADARDSSDYYEDQKSMRDYTNMANGAKALSVLFMILQFLL